MATYNAVKMNKARSSPRPFVITRAPSLSVSSTRRQFNFRQFLAHLRAGELYLAQL